MRHLLDTTTEELAAWLAEHKQPAYRAAQIQRWLFAGRAHTFDDMAADLEVAPRARSVFEIKAVGRGILLDDEQLLDPGGDQPLRLAQHVGGRPGDQIAAQPRDDAERAAIVASL